MSLRHKDLEIEYVKLNHSRRMIKIGFAIFALCSITIIVVMFINIVEQREKEKRQDEVINKLSYENTNLQKINNDMIREVNQVQNQYRQILIEKRQSYTPPINNQYSSYQNETRKTPININPTPAIKESKINNQQNIYTAPKYEAPKYTAPKKMYERYSSAKLVSDSKIEVMSDNRLKSNMPIYGRYIDKPVVMLECGKNEIVYKIDNECTGAVFPLDKIYFKKSNAGNIQNHNRNTHMVECKYDYENGVMHDCDVKLIGIQ